MWTLPVFDWPQKKEKCLSCAHYMGVQDNSRDSLRHTVMLCKIGNRRGRRGIGSCIDNRTLGKCGPDATLWEGKP